MGFMCQIMENKVGEEGDQTVQWDHFKSYCVGEKMNKDRGSEHAKQMKTESTIMSRF